MTNNRTITYAQALYEATRQEMERDDSVFVFGLNVDDARGLYGTTLDLHKTFGRDRNFDTPLSEDAMTGVGRQDDLHRPGETRGQVPECVQGLEGETESLPHGHLAGRLAGHHQLRGSAGLHVHGGRRHGQQGATRQGKGVTLGGTGQLQVGEGGHARDGPEGELAPQPGAARVAPQGHRHRAVELPVQGAEIVRGPDSMQMR